MTYRRLTLAEHFAPSGPKRILALDGGGLRGILTLGILKRIEDELRKRHGNDAAFRLCHDFDLIAGTSTGTIIAASLAIGWSVDDITAKSLQQTLLQWMSESPTARQIDGDLEALEGDLIGGAALLSYLRYNVEPEPTVIRELLGDEANTVAMENLTAVDAPENMQVLHRLGIAAGQRRVQSDHFPAAFNLT